MEFFEIIRERIGNRKAVMPVFGDAESMVTAALLLRVLPSDKVHFIHIDHGLLRHGEGAEIRKTLKSLGAKNIICVNAENGFLTATAAKSGRIVGPLAKTNDPYEKRFIIEEAIKRTFFKVAESIGDDAVIVGVNGIGKPIITFERGILAKLVKDLGIRGKLLRQPFPLPALAVRILCNDAVIAVTTEQRECLYSVVDSFEKGYSSRLVPIRTVGIRDGKRSYKSMALICSKGIDSNFEIARKIADAVHRELGYINRVVLRIDSDAPAEPYHDRTLHICREAADILREADAIVAEELESSKATQFFAVLIPLVEDKSKLCSVAIRAVVTDDFKTADVAMPGEDVSIDALRRAVEKSKNILVIKLT